MTKRSKDSLINAGLFLLMLVLSILGGIGQTSYFNYIAYVPLFFLLRRLEPVEALIYGFMYGLLLGAELQFWLSHFEKLDPFLMAMFSYAIVLAIVFATGSYLMRRYDKNTFIQIFAAGWILYLMQVVVHYLWFAKAFIKISNMQSFFDWVLPYLGTGIVEMLFVSFGCAVGLTIYVYIKKQSLTPVYPYLVFFAIMLGIGMYQDVAGLQPKNNTDTVKVAVIQGNFSWDWGQRVEYSQQILDYYLDITNEVAQQGAQIVVWPEYAVAADIIDENKNLNDQIVEASKKLDVVIVLGSLDRTNDKVIDSKWIGYDVSLVYDPVKGRLKPYRAVYPYSSNVLRGTEPMIFETKFGNFPVLSCFEIAHHKFVNDYFHQGKQIDFVIAIANNQVFQGTNGYYRLESHARRIAGEINRYLLYVTNTGPTTILNHQGQTVARVPDDQQGYLLYDVEKKSGNSVYSQLQEILPFLLTGGVFLYVFKKVKK